MPLIPTHFKFTFCPTLHIFIVIISTHVISTFGHFIHFYITHQTDTIHSSHTPLKPTSSHSSYTTTFNQSIRTYSTPLFQQHLSLSSLAQFPFHSKWSGNCTISAPLLAQFPLHSKSPAESQSHLVKCPKFIHLNLSFYFNLLSHFPII